MFFSILLLVIFIHFLIGMYDFSFYRIPNLLLGGLLLLYAFYAGLFLNLHIVFGSLIIFALLFIIGFVLYALKIIGAGDAKYIAVASLWAGTHGIVPLLFFISLVGGGLAIMYLLCGNYIGRFSDYIWLKIQKIESLYPIFEKIWTGSGVGSEKGKRENIGSRMVPYGIAIATGSIITLMINPLTH